MARRAVWKAHRNDPRTSLGWFLRDEGSRELAHSGTIVAVAFVLGAAFEWGLWWLAVLPVIALHVPSWPRQADDLNALAAIPAPGPSFPGRIEVWHGNSIVGPEAVLGMDDGIMTYVDGWLHFAGERTEFSICARDIVNETLAEGAQRISLREGGVLSFAALELWQKAEFCRTLRTWLAEAPTPEGASLLPPDRVHPSGLARAWRGFLSPIVVSITGMLLVHRLTDHAGMAGTALFCALGITPHQRLKSILRLAREERRAFANQSRPEIGP